MTFIFLASLLLGAIAGILAGLFGIGGGIILVPLLAWLFKDYHFPDSLVMIMAIATSLATIIPTSIASSLAHHRHQNLLWPFVKKLLPGLIAGSLLMSFIAVKLPATGLRLLFIAYLLYVATTMALQKKPIVSMQNADEWIDYLAGMVIGGLSTLLGIGGGTLTVPYLLGKSIAMKNAVAISSACGLPIAITGTLGYIIAGWNNPELPDYSLGYIYWPAFIGISLSSVSTASIGARLATLLPAAQLKRYFSILLYLIAAKMLFG